MQVSAGFKYFLWAWRNLLNRHKRAARKKKPQEEQQTALLSQISRWMRSVQLLPVRLVLAEDQIAIHTAVIPRSSNALRPPRSDPEFVRLWKVCGARESGGREAELTSPFPPEPSAFYHKRHSSRSRFSTRKGKRQRRRAAGTRQHGTARPPRHLRGPGPPPPGRARPHPAPAAQPTWPLRARPRLLWPAGLGAALPGSARRAPTHLPGSARPGPAPQPPSLPAPPRRFYKGSCFEIYNYILQRIQGYVWNGL